MPFTISHVAAVVPFSRLLTRWRLLSATIIGSMVPDFGFLMPWRPPRIDTHSALALATFCLPVGLATFWLFQWVIKTPLNEVLPDGAYRRWRPWAEPARLRSPLQWLLAALGVEIGAISHLIWDGFTHEGARGPRIIPLLDEPLVDFAGHEMIGVRFLQDASSLLGLAAVFIAVVYALRPGPAAAPATRRRLTPSERHAWWFAYALAVVVLAALCLLIRPPHYEAGRSLGLVIANYAIATLRGVAAAVLVVSVALTFRLRAKP